ncbi:hypothetical protein EKD04_000270 [Chloroflexales bacterium ZM16-3]|nr:hypothetical protein [Chloroflexales bacterium ZM16-3]
MRHSRANPGRLAAQTGYRASTNLACGLALTASSFRRPALAADDQPSSDVLAEVLLK